ncbi:MAG: OsmC family protein [Candidatus Eisenbacteria bacterium]
MECTITFPGGMRVDAHFRDLHVATDQTVKGGGEGSAPTPFMTFLASLGTCAGYYVLNFCKSRDIPTEGIRITQNTVVNPETKMVEQVSIDIHVPPTFPEKYHAALIRSADQCTVKKHLEHPPTITTRTVVTG